MCEDSDLEALLREATRAQYPPGYAPFSCFRGECRCAGLEPLWEMLLQADAAAATYLTPDPARLVSMMEFEVWQAMDAQYIQAMYDATLAGHILPCASVDDHAPDVPDEERVDCFACVACGNLDEASPEGILPVHLDALSWPPHGYR